MDQPKAPSQQIVFDLELDDELASHVFTGKKLVEVRENNPEKWGQVKRGSVLRVVSQKSREQVFMIVIDTRTYDSLEVCLAAEGVRNLLPGEISHAKACSTYLKFGGSEDEEISKTKGYYSKFGAIAFEFRPLPHYNLFQFIFGTFDGNLILENLERHETELKITDIVTPKIAYIPITGDPTCRHRHSDHTTYLPIAGEAAAACMLCGKRTVISLSKKTYIVIPMPYDDLSDVSK